MPTLFTRIEPDDIKLLGSDTLVRLLHRLLLCEARTMKLSNHRILVPYEITVPDGGSDGEWKATAQTNEFIPRDWTRYQCKAEHITESKCRDEIAPKDKNGDLKVKARIKEVLEAGGCYAFFSNGHEVKPSGNDDINTIARDQLQKAGITPAADAVIEFFGCNRIADWTNKFPAAVKYVREVTKGFGGIHYFTFDGWAKQANISGPFFENDALSKKIAAIRETLLNGTPRMIRMTGLSGVGKSRLVYEALKPSDAGNPLQNSLAASCIYLSYTSVSTDLLGLIGHLADNEYAAVIVVDDCPPEIHDRIATMVDKSLLSVVTIFHEPQQQRHDSYPLNLAPEEMEEVVEKILREDANLVARGDDAIKAVTSFSQGFPQIAKLIVEFHRAPTMDELTDRAKVFQKLLSGGETPDNTTLLTAQSLSLFRTIGGTTAKLEAHLSIIRELFCSDISEIDYRRSIGSQKKRRIVQQIADTLVLTPRPLGVALATDFISFFPKEKWKGIVDRLSATGLLSEFCRRIEELEFSDQAEELGKMFLEEGLPFNDAEYLLTGTTGSQMFRVLAVLNPSAAMQVAKRTVRNCPIEQLRNLKESRRNLVQAMELLAWDHATFQDAVELLFKLAAAENEGWSNNATGALKQLFHLQLSGTKVPAIERLCVIKDALQSNERAIRLVAIDVLGTALNFMNFFRMDDMTLGGKRDVNFDWRPKSNREAFDYWGACFLILRSCVLTHGEDEKAARDSLGKNIGVILQTPLLLELENEFKELSECFGHLWPEVKDQIKTVLDIHDHLSEVHKAALVRYMGYLTPSENDLASKLRDLVIAPGWHHQKAADGSYIDTSCKEAESFASELAIKRINLTPFLQQLLLGKQQQGFSFGTILGREHPQAKEFIEAILLLWPSLQPEERNASVASGIMFGMGNNDDEFRSSILDRLAAEPFLIDLLLPLTASINEITETDFIRIRKAVVESRLSPLMLRSLIPGMPLRMLSDMFLVKEFTTILEAKPESAPVVFEVLFSYSHGDVSRFEQFAEMFRILLLTEGLIVYDSQFGWMWHEVALKLIHVTDDAAWHRKVSKYICNFLTQNKTSFGSDYLGIVTSKLFEKAPVETWSVFGEVLTAGTDFEKYVLSEFLGKSGNMFDNTTSPLWTLPRDQFRAWVQAHRDIVPLILGTISLYTVEKQPDSQEVFKWHPHALVLLEEGTDEQKLERSLIGNLLSFGSTGSRVPYLEKRIVLVHDLSAIGDAKLARIARPLEDWLAEEVEQTKRKELNQQACFQ